MMQRKDVRGPGRLALAAAIAAAWTLAQAGAARADETSDEDLRKQVQDLQKELSELKETVRGGYFSASSDLEARVGELERLAGDDAMMSTFKYGMRTESADQAFQYQVGGWFQNDWGWFPMENDYDDAVLDGGTQFNAARLYIQGQVYGNVGFKTEYDFSDDEGEFKDVWMEIRNCRIGSIRIGHMKEPLGLETLTDDKFTTFMNRNATHALMPNRNTGVMLHGNFLKDKMLYQVGTFRTTENDHGSDFGSDSTSQALTGRLSGRLLEKDDGKMFLHLGVGGSFRDEDDAVTTATYAPLDDFFPVPTFSIAAEDLWIAAGEVAFVAGGFVAKAEYAHIDIDASGASSDAEADAWSVEAGFWLSGDQWSYSKESGSFSRPTVKKQFGADKGFGAWQVAARYDEIDPDDNSGADLGADTITVGVNWFLNPNTRISLNWTRFDDEGALDTFDWLGLRFQLDF